MGKKDLEIIFTNACVMNPTNKEMRAALLASQTLLGQDRFSRKFIKGFRQGLYE